MQLDILYILGLLIVWLGNLKQIQRIIKTKSTKSISLVWVWAIVASIAIRLPRAVTSTYWAWQAGYIISFSVCLVLLSVIIYYRKKYPEE